MAMLYINGVPNKDMKRNLAKDYSARKLEYPKTLADVHAIYTATYHNKWTSGSEQRQQNNNDNKEKDGEEADDDTGVEEDLLGVHAGSRGEVNSDGDTKIDEANTDEQQVSNEANDVPTSDTAIDRNVSSRIAGLLGLHDSDDDYEENTKMSLVSYTSADKLIRAHITIPDTATLELHRVREDTVKHDNTHATINTSDDVKLHTGGPTALKSVGDEDTNIGVEFTSKEKRFLLSNKPLSSLLPMDFQQGGDKNGTT